MSKITNNFKEYGLNVELIGFNLPVNLIKGDEIIVTASTRPEHYKTSCSVNINDIMEANRTLSLNIQIPIEQVNQINKGTELILFSFKVKGKHQSAHKIAIARITPEDFTNIQNTTDQIKVIKISKSSEAQKKEFYKAKEKGFIDNYQVSEHNTIHRDIVGEMKVKLVLCEPYANIKQNVLKEKNQIELKPSKNKKEKSSNDFEFKELKSKNIFKIKSKNKNQYANML